MIVATGAARRCRPEAVSRQARIWFPAIDAYKWVASKLKPKRYGERIRADLAGDINVIVDRIKEPSD